LLARLDEDGESAALDALSALTLYSRDDSVRGRIRQSLASRNNAALSSAFHRDFGS